MAQRPESDAHQAALAFLFSRVDYERASSAPYGENAYKLTRMRELLSRLGNPHAQFPVVHVAGTKGKGSTAATIACLLSHAGYRTGLFSSPHLDRVEERLAIDGHCCSAADLSALIEELRPVVDSMDRAASSNLGAEGSCTYFELTTAMSLVHFARRQVDVAVLEVGMGGRLDSTNVCQPMTSVITSISFDHTRQLGSTLAAIAREKAGIIKPGVPVVSGVVDDEPQQVILDIARAQASPVLQLGRDFDFSHAHDLATEFSAPVSRIDFHWRNRPDLAPHEGLELSLLGRHQGANAALALATLETLIPHGFHCSIEQVRRGLKSLRWPARVEVVSRQPTVILDVAHNVASIQALLETLDQSFRPSRRLLVFATTQEKPVRGMLELLLPRFDRVVLTRYRNNPRGVPPEELASVAKDFPTPFRVCPDPATAWAAVRDEAKKDDLICVTGSFFIAGEIRREAALRPLGGDNARFQGD